MKLLNISLISSMFLYYLLFLPQIVTAGNADNMEENKWELSVELEKQEYLLYEKIWLDITLLNITSNSIRTIGIDAPNHRGFNLIVKDNNGTELVFSGPKQLFGPSSGLLLMAEDYEYHVFDLLGLFGKSMTERKYNAPWGYFHYLPEGSYSVQAHFDGAVSNIVFFNIIEPSGFELDALKLLGEVSKIQLGRKTMHLAAKIFQELVDKYPNSVYAETSFMFSRKNSKEAREAITNGTFDYRGYNLELLDKFPNSGNTRAKIWRLAKDLEKNEKNEILNKVLKDYPNKRAGKFAKQKLKQLKQEEMLKQKEEE